MSIPHHVTNVIDHGLLLAQAMAGPWLNSHFPVSPRLRVPAYPSNVTNPPMTTQPQPLVSVTTPHTRYGASSFRIKDLQQPRPGQSPYFETDRIRALAVYAETGNQNEAARQTGIDQTTVHNWVHDESSAELVTELRSTLRYNRGWELANLVGDGLAQIKQAFEEGDPVVLKDGRTVYRRASLRDLTVTTSILIDKWMLISGAISSETHLLGRMDALSEQLTVMGGSLKSSPPSPPPDGTPIEEPRGENLIG